MSPRNPWALLPWAHEAVPDLRGAKRLWAAAPTEASPLTGDSEAPASAGYAKEDVIGDVYEPGSAKEDTWRDWFDKLVQQARLMFLPLLIFACFVIGSTIMYHKLEGWSWGLSVYVCIVVLTTVGSGEVAPNGDA